MFKSLKKKKQIRQRRRSDEEEENEELEENSSSSSVLAETLERQKLRQRSAGLNAATLNTGFKSKEYEYNLVDDPFKLKTGGLLDYKTAQKAAAATSDKTGPSEENIGTQFSKETRIRDEDEEMRRFIESEMSKRIMGTGATDNHNGEDDKFTAPEDKALHSLPEHLRRSSSKKNEEMLSSQMLSGIPEVDLGIDEKIRNIEATEAAKKMKSENKVESTSPPTISVNFRAVKRNRVSKPEPVEETVVKRTCVVGELPEEKIVVQQSRMYKSRQDPDRATDDLHLINFKKQFQRK